MAQAIMDLPNVAGAIRDTANNTLIQASGLSQSMYFYILNDNASPGNYPIILSAVLNGISYPNNSAATTITEYGTPGGFVAGSASGQMKAQDTTYLPFSMTYRVKRTRWIFLDKIKVNGHYSGVNTNSGFFNLVWNAL